MRTMPVWACVALSGCLVARGSGVADEEVREVGAFDEVRNSTSVAVSVIEGEAASVVVRCDGNLLDEIRTEVRGSELRVSTPPGTSVLPRTECAVDVTAPALFRLTGEGSAPTTATGAFPELVSIDADGSGAVRVDGLVTEGVTVRSSGSGGVVASGAGRYAELESSGSGGIDARDLSVEEADLTNAGSGEVSLSVSEHATVVLAGSGDVRIFGTPRVEAEDSGSGDVVVE